MSGLVIVGAGGFAREAARAALDGAFEGEVLGFLDDSPDLAGRQVMGLPVLGPIPTIAQYPQAQVIIATGRPDSYTSRHAIAARLGLPSSRYATLVHPRANLASDTLIGPGSVVLAGVSATCAVRIGSHVALMPNVLLTHDCSVSDYANLTGGVTLAGGVGIGVGAYIGAGTLIRQGLTVGDWSMVGMGSLVLQSVPARRLWFGRPAADCGPAPAADYQDQPPLGAQAPGAPGDGAPQCG